MANAFSPPPGGFLNPNMLVCDFDITFQFRVKAVSPAKAAQIAINKIREWVVNNKTEFRMELRSGPEQWEGQAVHSGSKCQITDMYSVMSDPYAQRPNIFRVEPFNTPRRMEAVRFTLPPIGSDS